MLANAARSSEQQMVERQAAERLTDLRVAGDDGDLILGEGGAEHPLHQLGTLGVQFRDFDHRPVTGGQRTGQPLDDHAHREIPGSNNTHHAQRLILNPGLATVGGTLLGLHPLSNPGPGFLQRRERAQQVDDTRQVVATMTEVCRRRLNDFLLVLNQHADQAIEQFTALLCGPDIIRQISRALHGEGFTHAHHFG
ncbi:hypothetical protein D3C72_1122080 [compost metagenome]